MSLWRIRDPRGLDVGVYATDYIDECDVAPATAVRLDAPQLEAVIRLAVGCGADEQGLRQQLQVLLLEEG